MKVKIKKLDPNAKIPTQAHDKDFCYDVYAVSRKRVKWRTWEYRIGLAFEIVRDIENIGEISARPYTSYPFKEAEVNRWLKINFKDYNIKLDLDFRPRSSVYKTGLVLSNCVGTLDELYRGEVKAYFYSCNIFGKKYKVGDRIGQIKLGFTLPIEFEEVPELDINTERGIGGFGSTGR